MRNHFKLNGGLRRLWMRIQEPRALSMIYFFVYIAVTVMGLAVISDPPRTIQGTLGQTLVSCWAVMLVVGGALGAGTVLQGAWWLERGGAILCMSAMLIYGVAYIGLPVTQLSLRIASLSFVIFAILAFAARLVKTRRYAYDPEK